MEDDEEGGCTASASACDVPSPAVEDTSTEDSQMSSERTSESASGDSGSESSRPLSPSPAENHYYYFYQGTVHVCCNNCHYLSPAVQYPGFSFYEGDR